MEIKPFKGLNVTTMTLIARFGGKIYLDPIFCLLPITWIEMPVKKRQTKKVKIPHCKILGSLLSLRFRGFTRGIFRTASKKHFRNSITMDISTSLKNISLKLSERSIQMCGPTSVEMGQEAITHLFRHIHTLQHFLDYMNDHMEQARFTVEKLTQWTLGQETIRVSRDVRQYDNVLLAITEDHDDFEVIVPKEKELDQASKKYPAQFDKKIAQFLLQFCPEFAYHSQLIDNFQHILETQRVIDETLHCNHIYKAMVNYNYHLDFRVNRDHLKHVFDEAQEWTARYDPRLDHTVTLQIPYIVPPELQFMRKKGKKHCHTFMVQKSGVITQSGPDEEMMKDAYYQFMKIIGENKAYLEKSELVPPA
uniref:Transcription factor TFIID n=1 Tax=Pithovirus LCPAC304 TaxID=2506594 RepID=A0A481Z7Z1_9VIRU|nr:MAG: transcription factor TFIID [Pithovirus LCPAC304]